LEALWNDALNDRTFHLHGAYPRTGFINAGDEAVVCSAARFAGGKAVASYVGIHLRPLGCVVGHPDKCLGARNCCGIPFT
jgi:hypothetical protein